MRFMKKRDYKLSVSDGSVNVLSICKKNFCLFAFDFAAVYPLQLNNFKFTVG